MTSSSQSIAIAPSILASDFLRLGDAVHAAESAGADRLHIDVMDGRFVPNITVGQPIVECIRAATNMTLETHLMIVEPEKYVSEFIRAGADIVIVHQEASPHLYRTVQQIQDEGARAGVALNPGTPWVMAEDILSVADLILVMTVNPGFGGQKYIDMTSKLLHLREAGMRRGRVPEMEVDGGITESTAPSVARAGARVLVAGTSVYRSPQGVKRAVDELRAAAEEGIRP